MDDPISLRQHENGIAGINSDDDMHHHSIPTIFAPPEEEDDDHNHHDPSPRSITLANEARFADCDITFYADQFDEEYEYIRVPKKRDYDLIAVAHRAPRDRDSSNLPLVATRPADNARVTLWAKLDTGAGANVINRSTVDALLGASARAALHAPTFQEIEFGLLGHASLKPMHYVNLSFWAGRSGTLFENVRFYVIQDQWQDPNGDGVPNVVLGYDFLRDHHMVMIDFEYQHDADPELEVISPKAEDERPGYRSLSPVIYPNVAGLVREDQRPKPK